MHKWKLVLCTWWASAIPQTDTRSPCSPLKHINRVTFTKFFVFRFSYFTRMSIFLACVHVCHFCALKVRKGLWILQELQMVVSHYVVLGNKLRFFVRISSFFFFSSLPLPFPHTMHYKKREKISNISSAQRNSM